jgi:hypothetical protein
MRNVSKFVEKIMLSNIFPKVMPLKKYSAKCGTADRPQMAI